MNIDRFKRDHTAILGSIDTLRTLSHAGVARNAAEIARGIVAMSSAIKLHLSAEDRLLYPALEQSGNQALARMGARMQAEMGSLLSAYAEFAGLWNTTDRVRDDAEGFRAGANRVLKALYERVRQEDREFYPLIERQAA